MLKIYVLVYIKKNACKTPFFYLSKIICPKLFVSGKELPLKLM